MRGRDKGGRMRGSGRGRERSEKEIFRIFEILSC